MDRSRDAFDSLVEQYDAWYDTPKGQALFASELACLEPLVARLEGPLLEIGVGTGRFAKSLGIRHGVDPALRMAEIAASRGIAVECAPGENLPYEDRTFGGVLLAFTLCFVNDPVKVLREARRVLRADGGLVLGIMPRGTPWADMYADRGLAGHPVYSAARFYSLPEVGVMLAMAGFRAADFRSTLLTPPDSIARVEGPYIPDAPRAGRIPNAGFVAIAAYKANPCRS